MPSNTFKNLRNYSKPNIVRVLFVGESRPEGGTFFYNENSNLYRETKKAFNEYFGENIFSLDTFKKWNCWLYDICENPVNGLDDHDRRIEILRNIPRLEECIKSVNPKYIVVCKRGDVRNAILVSDIMRKYRENDSIFFLPFPSCGRQKEYRESLINILKILDIQKFTDAFICPKPMR